MTTGNHRDEYKARVYEAEWELRFIAEHNETGCVDFYGQTLELPQPRKFGDLDGVQAFVDKVCAFSPVTDLWTPPGSPPKVAPRSGDKHAHYQPGYNVIAVPPHKGSAHSWAMDELVVLHELAHFFNRRTDEASHGLSFVNCYLDLLDKVLHPTWKLLLLRALDQRGVPLS
jgi:putative metallohydrolase (TIGR04338 family)